MLTYLQSPIFKTQCIGEVRHGLGFLAAWLVTHGYMTSGTLSDQVLLGLATALVTMGLSAYDKFRAKQLLLVAQAHAGRTTEASLKTYIADGLPVPSVLTPATQVPVLLPGLSAGKGLL
jgi:hypothetical protein